MADKKNPNVDPEACLSAPPSEPKPACWTSRDVLLYALGVGATESQFLYEGDERFSPLPTYPLVLAQKGTSYDVVPYGNTVRFPGLKFEPLQLLHGEQGIEILKPLPPSGDVTIVSRIVDLLDKGSGAVLVTESVIADAKSNDVYSKTTSKLFIRGLGNFGGKRGDGGENNAPPKRSPDAVFVQQTSPTQALLYRLSGDYNPLHADNNLVQLFGFDKPILHGLCTMGHASRAVLSSLLENDTSRVKAISVRFAKPVFPGETLVTEMWKVAEDKIVFQVKVKERDAIVINNAAVRTTPNSIVVNKKAAL